MKKFKMSTSIIIIVVSVSVIVGAFLLISNHFAKSDEPSDIAISSVQNVLLRNMENNYPPTPKEVLKYYHKTSKDLIYFGDNQIDIHSLRFAKYSIAMANSNEEVKSNAKQITKLTNDEDGAIKHLLEMIEN